MCPCRVIGSQECARIGKDPVAVDKRCQGRSVEKERQGRTEKKPDVTPRQGLPLKGIPLQDGGTYMRVA